MTQLELDLRASMREYQLPDYMEDGTVRYVLHGIPPGHFLTAVICNDLSGAVAAADRENQIALVQWVKWFYNEAPSPCWGSAERFDAWMEKKRAEREKVAVEGRQ